MNILLKISKRLNKSYAFRVIVAPIVIAKRKMELARFYTTKDATFIRSYKGTHNGERCFIIGNGPSLTGEDLDMIKGEFSFAFNRIYNIYGDTVWRPSIYMCEDRQCLMDEIQNIKKLKGSVKFVSNFAKKYGRNEKDELHYYLLWGKYEPRVENVTMETISEDVSSFFSTKQTITCSGIEFAIYMGFKEIYLLGVDHNYPISIDKNGKVTVDKTIKSHFNNGGSKEESLHYIYYDAATQCYQACEDYAKEHGIRIINATRGGKLDVFERKSLEEIIRE